MTTPRIRERRVAYASPYVDGRRESRSSSAGRAASRRSGRFARPGTRRSSPSPTMAGSRSSASIAPRSRHMCSSSRVARSSKARALPRPPAASSSKRPGARAARSYPSAGSTSTRGVSRPAVGVLRVERPHRRERPERRRGTGRALRSPGRAPSVHPDGRVQPLGARRDGRPRRCLPDGSPCEGARDRRARVHRCPPRRRAGRARRHCPASWTTGRAARPLRSTSSRPSRRTCAM